MITFPEVVEIDLPTIIVLIIVWWIGILKIGEVDNKISELKQRLPPR